MLLIIDVSVLVSVLISRNKSFARDILELAYDKQLTLVTCDEIYTELRTSVAYEKIRKFKTYNSAKIGSFVAWYKYNALFIPISAEKQSSRISRDVKDNIYLLLAEVSNADFIVTIDNDLMTVKEIGNTKIVMPEEFIKQHKKGESK